VQNVKTLDMHFMKIIEKENALKEETLDSVILQKQILL
jgi:hypothetical protein